MSEHVLDEENWKTEAEAVIKDIRDHVKYVNTSEDLKGSNSKIYFNLTTLEKKDYCIELSAQGFKIVGHSFDCNNTPEEEVYETPYALLNKISGLFQTSFGNQLFQKLTELQKE